MRSKPAITVGLIQDQIKGLQNTQSHMVGIRRDIVAHVIGDELVEEINVSSVTLQESNPGTKRLAAAVRDIGENSNTRSSSLVYVNRQEVLDLMLEAIARKARAPEPPVEQFVPTLIVKEEEETEDE